MMGSIFLPLFVVLMMRKIGLLTWQDFRVKQVGGLHHLYMRMAA